MTASDPRQLLVSALDDLPGQLRAAAKALLDRPQDAALMSMRRFAEAAGVQPASLTRLAQRLGFDGYEGLQQLFANAIRKRADTFSNRTEGLRLRRDMDGDVALVADTMASAAGHLRTLSDERTGATLGRAADLIIARKRLFFVGARSSFAAMHLAAYLLSLIGEETVLVDGAGGIGFDKLMALDRTDAVLALSIAPYTRNTAEAVSFAVEKRAAVIALTDSHASPLARQATEVIVLPTDTPSFLQTMTPALAVVECLAALVAAKRGKSAIKAIARSEVHLARFSSYVSRRPAQKDRT